MIHSKFLLMNLVVSGILEVFRSSGHELGSKDLQNKQGIGDYVSTDSPMLKLDIEIERECLFFSKVFFTYLFVFIPSPFMKDENDPFFMES